MFMNSRDRPADPQISGSDTSRYCACAIAGDVVTVGSLGDFRVEKYVPRGLLASLESHNRVMTAVTPGGTLEACGTL